MTTTTRKTLPNGTLPSAHSSLCALNAKVELAVRLGLFLTASLFSSSIRRTLREFDGRLAEVPFFARPAAKLFANTPCE